MVDSKREQAGKGPNKVYFGKDKIRFDSLDQRGGGAVIFDLTKQNYTVLMPDRHMYMEMPSQMAETRGLFHFWRTGDVDNACSDWQKMPGNQGGSCRKIGSDTVNGRNTVKYEATNADGKSGVVWLDPKLRFPVKWQGKDDSWDLKNIQEGSQPDSLFEIPVGYQKFDMGAMMQQRQKN
jgi:hypothetical protein